MAAINGYIDRRSEEKKASGKVWEEAGGLNTYAQCTVYTEG